MKKLTEVFSPEVLEALQNVYFETGDNNCYSLVPREEAPPLTSDNFKLVTEDGEVYFADDFSWYREDGSDRDFVYDKDDDLYLSNGEIPSEVADLLDTEICIKFATEHLNNAKVALDKIDNNSAKDAIYEAIKAFDESQDSIEKLKIAYDALQKISNAMPFDDFAFEEIVNVIEEVLYDLQDDED